MEDGGKAAVKPPPGSRKLPDLSEFRASIRVKGKPLSETVVALRRQERY